MFDYTDATLEYVLRADIAEPNYHDIDYDVLKKHVARLKDHPHQDLPPVVLKKHDEGYIIRDGRHRMIAYTHAERVKIPAIILP